jgi:GH35 family endo-1,4-beta-xylanase
VRRCFAGALLSLIAASVSNCGSSDQRSTDNVGIGGTSGTGGAGGDADASPMGELQRAAIEANKLLGTAVSADGLRFDGTFRDVLAREFNYVTAENAMKWGPLEPSPGVYAWGDADAFVDFAEQHGQAIKGHTLVWHQQLPSWVDSSLGADALNAAIKSHIETTLAHFHGRVRAWDVVNEAVDTSTASGYTEGVLWQTLGPSYIESAFRWARAADPDVLLFYNEVGIERMGPKADFTYAMIRDLLQKGVPIDGIGFQSHLSTSRYPAESDLRANIRRFADLGKEFGLSGLKVNISELDARTILVPGTQDARWQAERIAFQQVVGSCVAEPGCEAVTFWGFTDKYSWINDKGDPDDPLIFDRNYVAKPAYQGVLSGLTGQLPTRGDNLIVNGDFAAGTDHWYASGGTLVVGSAPDRDGIVACVSGRTQTSDGLVQSNLLTPLLVGGSFSFSAWVKLKGASKASVAAAFGYQQEGQVQTVSLASGVANDAEWYNLAGYFTLGFPPDPLAITLNLSGPPADVELCVANVEIRPLSVP